MARIPGDPTTLRAIEAMLLHPEGRETPAEYGEFWFHDPAWMAERRAQEVAWWEKQGRSRPHA
jgi:hypothetical protein